MPPGYTAMAAALQNHALTSQLENFVEPIHHDLRVDLRLVTGHGRVENPDQTPVAVGERTVYDHRPPDWVPTVREHFDFDADGADDLAVLGRHEATAEGAVRFVPDPGGLLQGVYLSGGERGPDLEVSADDPDADQPHFTRLADFDPDFDHQGLLKSLSEADLRDTDLYVFRAADGRMITERRGLRPEDLRLHNQGGSDGGQIYYQVLMRGETESTLAARRHDFSEWQGRTGIDPELHRRRSDHLRPGEPIRIVAINRASGYVGSVTTVLPERQGADVSFPVPDLVLRPPNLKVRVERTRVVDAGLDRGQEREHTVGFEGAGRTADKLLQVFTEWHDQDGRPLPEGLRGFGYTGRLTKVVATDVLGPVQDRLSHFAIEPGTQRQLIRLSDEGAGTEHLYVQVNARPPNRSPSFAALGAGAGALRH